MATYDIVAMTLKGRANHATQVQQVLTENGCAIRARIGLHEGVQDACSNEGLILLQVCGSGDDIAALLFYQLITASAMNGLDMQGRVLGHVVAGGLLQLAFTWFATAQMGMDGFLWGQIASALLIVGLNLRALARRTQLRVRWAEWFVLTALGSLVLGLTVRLIHGGLLGLLEEGPAVGLSLAAGAGVYLIVLRLMGIHPWATLRAVLPAKWRFGARRTAALAPNPGIGHSGR